MTPHDNRVTLRATRPRSTSSAAEAHDTPELRGMLRVLPQLGYDLDALLTKGGLRREDVENPDAVIAPSACAAVFAAAHKERRVPNLPLQLAVHTPVGANPLLDYLIVSADSVGAGLHRLARYLGLVNRGIGLAVRESSSPVRVVVERARGAFETELTVALSLLRFRKETDGQPAPSVRELHPRARRCRRVRGGAGMPGSRQSVVEWVGLVESRDEPRAETSRSGSEPLARATGVRDPRSTPGRRRRAR